MADPGDSYLLSRFRLCYLCSLRGEEMLCLGGGSMVAQKKVPPTAESEALLTSSHGRQWGRPW